MLSTAGYRLLERHTSLQLLPTLKQYDAIIILQALHEQDGIVHTLSSLYSLSERPVEKTSKQSF